eukprot:331586-Chlamydomonas_euryale.AAC.1
MPGNLSAYQSVLSAPATDAADHTATTRRRQVNAAGGWGSVATRGSSERQARVDAQLRRMARREAERAHQARKARGLVGSNSQIDDGWVECTKATSGLTAQHSVASLGGDGSRPNSRPNSRGSDFQPMASMGRTRSGRLSSAGGTGGVGGTGGLGDAANAVGFGSSAKLGATPSGREKPRSSFRVRSVRAWQRPDEDFALPLDRDALAPPLRDHNISTPTMQDLSYILNRWADRWSSDRQEEAAVRAKRSGGGGGGGGSSGGRRAVASSPSGGGLSPHGAHQEDDEKELWDLDLFGAPTFAPGL